MGPLGPPRAPPGTPWATLGPSGPSGPRPARAGPGPSGPKFRRICPSSGTFFGLEAESASKMTQKVDVGNPKRFSFQVVEYSEQPYVKSWVRSIFAVILERYSFFRAEK